MSSDKDYDSDWTTDFSDSDSDSEIEGKIYALEVLPQAIRNRPSCKARLNKEDEIFQKVQFGPLLSLQERSALEDIVREISHLFVTRHRDLSSITLEEHHIDLVEGAKPVQIFQRQLALDKGTILKNEIDKLLEGSYMYR